MTKLQTDYNFEHEQKAVKKIEQMQFISFVLVVFTVIILILGIVTKAHAYSDQEIVDQATAYWDTLYQPACEHYQETAYQISSTRRLVKAVWYNARCREDRVKWYAQVKRGSYWVEGGQETMLVKRFINNLK